MYNITHGSYQQIRVESSPIQSSQSLGSRSVHIDRVESKQVCVSSIAFLVLFEQ